MIKNVAYSVAIIYILVFLPLSIANSNFEFIYYGIITTLLFFLLYYLNKKKSVLSRSVIAGLVFLGLLHLAGGNVTIGGDVLYNLWLIPPDIFKYDNLVHTYAMFITTIAFHEILKPRIGHIISKPPYLFGILILISSGIGASAEIIELIAVIFLNAGDRVGGYYNNAIDLIFNLSGAIIASCFLWLKSTYFSKAPKSFLRRASNNLSQPNSS